MNGYFPIVLQLRGRSCVIIGGGTIAERKLRGLIDAGADHITVISPIISAEIAFLANHYNLSVVQREYEEQDVKGAWLLFAATNDKSVNAAIAALADRLGVLVNAADEHENSSFISPSVVRRNDLLLAVTACGASPALSQHIKQELEQQYGPQYAHITTQLRSLRECALARIGNDRDRKAVLKLAAEEAVELSHNNLDIDGWLQSLMHRIDRGLT